MRRSALLAYHARGVRAGRSRSYRLRGGRETVRRRNGRNCAWWIGAKIIAATRVPITAVSVQGEPGNGRSWEECFYSDASRVRIAEKPVAVVAVPPPCLLFVVLVQRALLAASGQMVCGPAFAVSFGLGLIPLPSSRPRALLGRLYANKKGRGVDGAETVGNGSYRRFY
jgi:hypothetical protein